MKLVSEGLWKVNEIESFRLNLQKYGISNHEDRMGLKKGIIQY
jgi:hypothetical protein